MTHVLCVDDKEQNLYYLTSLLRGHGYTVDSARHGAEALVVARRTPPDVIVSDLLMPVMDGYTLLRHWKADRRLRAIPFIVYTATYTEPADEELALSLGAEAFILKPAEPEDFLSRLRSVEGMPRAPLDAAPLADASDASDATEEPALLRLYSATLIRKLEEKTLQLEETNESLQRDIAAREEAEARLRKAEEQLRHAQKMEAVGRLAGGIAHDFNNILSIILTYSAMAKEQLPPGSPARADIAEVELAGERASDLTRQLLALSRHQIMQPRVLDLEAMLRSMEKMLRRLLGEDVELLITSTEHLGKVIADPSQMEQVVLNLVVNARDAMPRGGKITLALSDVDLESVDGSHGPDGSHASREPQRYVQLSVTDTGRGMDHAARERIFEPFFTTKESGKGTGLGLSIVFGILEQSGGNISVSSEPGRGSTFRVLLPRTDRPPETTVAAPTPPVTLRGTETLLVVEDDDQVRQMACTLLQRQGYDVLTAQNAGEAFLISEKHGGRIHLLLTDVVMPRMNGRELAERLVAARPDMRVLYMSGFAEDTVTERGVLAPGIAVLQKPIRPEALLRQVREVLA